MGEKKRLLVVENETNSQGIVPTSLQDDFAVIDIVGDLEAAHEKVIINKYDCFLVDINLPDGNGATLVRYIKNQNPQGNKNTPIVMMSEMIDNRFKEKYKDKFQGLLSKPFSESEVQIEVLMALSKSFIKKVSKNKEEVELVLTHKPTSPIDDNSLFEIPVGRPYDIVMHKKEIKKVLTKMSKTFAIKALFKNADTSKKGYILRRIGLMINISIAISDALGWASDKTVEKLVFASYLHDIPIIDNEKLIRPQDQHQFMKDDSLTHAERDLILSHPYKIVEAISHIGIVPSDVLVLISQHHERPDGEGFPEKMDHKQISPLSCVFIIANLMASHLLEHGVSTSEVHKFIINSDGAFKGVTFRDIFRAFKKMKLFK